MQPDNLLVEHTPNPLGLDVLSPAFSWSYQGGQERGRYQTAYRIIASSREEDALLGHGDVWDSGKVLRRRSIHVLYGGKALLSRKRYYWKVQTWDQDNRMSESGIAWWEMGLLSGSDWRAKWIGEPVRDASEQDALPIFRKEFVMRRPAVRARVYAVGLGHYELRLNGGKVGSDVLEPGWTNYNKTCLYSVYDITDLLQQGPNAVGVLLGNGFYNVTGGRYRKFKGSFGRPKCLVQLEIVYDDGTEDVIVTDTGWQTASGPITFSCIYGGEDYDARREPAGWDLPGFRPEDGDAWQPAAAAEAPSGKLKRQATAPLQVMRSFRPVHIAEPAPGVYVADFGQNFSGWVALTVSGPAGSQITLTPAELLREDGTVNQKWTGSPYKLKYTLKGEGDETWSPRFTYYGFRYVQIEGAALALTAQNRGKTGAELPMLLALEGQMIYPDIRTAGRFACSDELLLRTHEIINWAMLSNTKSIFTDCPHREKLGWLEQVHLMGPSLAYNYDVQSLFVKTMEDIRDAQLASGMVPTTAPEYVVFSEQWRCFRDSVPWGAAYVLIGWNLHQLYGHTRILSEHYKGMKAYVDYVTANSDDYIVRGGLGDWYDVGDEDPGFAKNTPVAHTETAMYYHAVDVFVSIARQLGRLEDAARYEKLREQIRTAFNREFFDPASCRYATGSHTSQAMPLVLGLVDERYKQQVLEVLIEDIRGRRFHTTAGDVGHRYVLLALAENGRSDLIYEMTRSKEHPSYGYQLAHGATTLTEAWDGPTVGKSQNHFMLGHLEEWLYAGLAGFAYRYDHELETYSLSFRPFVTGEVEEASAEHHLPAGTASIRWRRDGKALTLDIAIPPNCIGEARIPASALTAEAITEGRTPLSARHDIKLSLSADSHTDVVHEAVIRLSSGHYHLRALLP
ncbi:Bacterial alpha-L-rhamnosidase [Paenibacillus konkukensis]|uniref:alpha-L-rhamnosidase n=1 Tax=Paenibacillus konkukensis TaxID=2020716 RepID=A0ABY4RJ04_9BACL|nr:alpha-L-rhamnosidase [Paenibacillus konkukensis]UQZ81836.1 Bacterial alpha-L-rhamnosidase [Paenibacillus konkukensis]